jgi:hypothetical protein
VGDLEQTFLDLNRPPEQSGADEPTGGKS